MAKILAKSEKRLTKMALIVISIIFHPIIYTFSKIFEDKSIISHRNIKKSQALV